jgi:hypothetical protein
MTAFVIAGLEAVNCSHDQNWHRKAERVFSLADAGCRQIPPDLDR